MKTITVKTDGKLSKTLLEFFDGSLSFSRFNKLLREKDIKVNGVRVKTDVKVCSGDIIDVYYEPTSSSYVYKSVFEDENVLIAVKPKGVTSERFYDNLKNQIDGLFFCHRLDRNTDGLMIFGKNQTAYDEIFNAFKAKTFEKTYLAEVYGKLNKKHDSVKSYIKKNAEKATVTVFDKKVDGALYAELEYNVVKELENSSLVEILLKTGRTHQIRAQMAHIGHFVLGDGKYGDDRINRALNVKELRLSSKKLVLHFSKSHFLAYLDGKEFTF